MNTSRRIGGARPARHEANTRAAHTVHAHEPREDTIVKTELGAAGTDSEFIALWTVLSS